MPRVWAGFQGSGAAETEAGNGETPFGTGGKVSGKTEKVRGGQGSELEGLRS